MKTLKDLDYSVLQQCMHCGMCLPTCPTYMETKRERNSPRGRISLMRAVADDELKLTPAFADEMSYCLGCLACQTACPAGVDYSNLLETARAEVQSAGLNQTFTSRFWRTVTIRGLFMRPRLLRLADRPPLAEVAARCGFYCPPSDLAGPEALGYVTRWWPCPQ